MVKMPTVIVEFALTALFDILNYFWPCLKFRLVFVFSCLVRLVQKREAFVTIYHVPIVHCFRMEGTMERYGFSFK